MTVLTPVRSDTLPENSNYRDDGCDVFNFCLSCPLPICKYDDPEYLRRTVRGARDQAILDARAQEKLSVTELAERFEVSTRTVHRILQSERLGKRQIEPEVVGLRVVPHEPRQLFRRPRPLPEIWPNNAGRLSRPIRSTRNERLVFQGAA